MWRHDARLTHAVCLMFYRSPLVSLCGLILYVLCGILMQNADAQQRGVLEGGRISAPPAEGKSAKRQAPKEDLVGQSQGKPTPLPAASTSSLGELLSIDVETAEYERLVDAAIAFVERQTLRNVSPAAIWQTIQTLFPSSARRGLSEPERRALDLLKNLCAWQELEATFSANPSEHVLRRSVAVVKSQAIVDPQFDDDRLQRILHTMESKGLFVPSSILFRKFVLPYRPMRVPQGTFVLEMPARPEYTDTEHEVVARMDFLAPLAPFCRIDFETVGTAELRVDKSDDGKRFERVQTWSSQQRGGLRGPVFLQPPVKSRFLLVTTIAPAETAVLRNLRFFALKEPAIAFCPKTVRKPLLDADFKESAWPRTPQVEGFVEINQRVFAAAQTTVRLIYDEDNLYLAAYVREPRQSTRVATATLRDAPLWEEESLEILFKFSPDETYRFLVSAIGTLFDSRNGDPSWNAEWQAVTRDYPLGWAAEIAIPLKSFQGNLDEGATVAMNILRHRKNVVSEQSSWAYHPDTPSESWGRLTLE